VELTLDGTISAVTGVLPAAMAANMRGHGLICPAACGPAAAWASSDLEVLAPRQPDPACQPHAWHADHGTSRRVDRQNTAQSRDIKGQDMKGQDMKSQDMAKRVLEVAGAGGHALLST
jgi:magnesium chelatase family protein